MKPRSLKDQFNALNPDVESLANVLQEVLEALPSKIAELPQHLGKDILHISIPANPGVLSEQKDFSERELFSQPKASIADQRNELLFTFMQEFTSRYPAMDCIIKGTCTIWGDYLGINIMTQDKSPLTIAREHGRSYGNIENYYDDQPNILGTEKMQQYALFEGTLQTMTYLCVHVLADGKDPNQLPPPKNTAPDGSPRKATETTRQRTFFWNKWAKSAGAAAKPSPKIDFIIKPL